LTSASALNTGDSSTAGSAAASSAVASSVSSATFFFTDLFFAGFDLSGAVVATGGLAAFVLDAERRGFFGTAFFTDSGAGSDVATSANGSIVAGVTGLRAVFFVAGFAVAAFFEAGFAAAALFLRAAVRAAGAGSIASANGSTAAFSRVVFRARVRFVCALSSIAKNRKQIVCGFHTRETNA
jgi:hypothetical protein